MDYVNFKVIHQKAKLRILLNKMIYFINIRVKYSLVPTFLSFLINYLLIFKLIVEILEFIICVK